MFPGSSTRRTIASWFAVGLCLAIALQWFYVANQGGLGALIGVGQDADVRSVIESDFGPLPQGPRGDGHDGRYVYVVARDVRGERGWIEQADVPAVRYRRILLPLLAALGGTLPPRATVIGMASLSALGVAMAAASVAAIAASLRARAWAPLGVVLNVGIAHSVVISSPDAMAIGLALAGTALCVSRRTAAAALLLTAAALTKETYVVVAIGAAVATWLDGDRRRALIVGGAPALVTAGWVVFVGAWLPAGSVGYEALGAPVMGFLAAADDWGRGGLLLVGSVTALMVVIAPIAAWRLRQPLLLWLALPWTALAILATRAVWYSDGPRTLAMSMVIAIVAAALWAARASPRARPRPADALTSTQGAA